MKNENKCLNWLTRVEKCVEGLLGGVEDGSKRPKKPMKGNTRFLPKQLKQGLFGNLLSVLLSERSLKKVHTVSYADESRSR